MAGASSSSNKYNYLYNGSRGSSSGGTTWWSGSPHYSSNAYANEWRVDSTGYLSYNYVDTPLGVRPVVSLKHGIKFSDGDGSSNSPYIVADR